MGETVRAWGRGGTDKGTGEGTGGCDSKGV